jgi:CheY-like chemotaxis protein/GAF domain-containing protein
MTQPDGSEKTPQFLVLPLAASQPGLVAALQQQGRVHVPASAEEALSALQSGGYDAVISSRAELFPLARAEARQRGELILDRLGQGLCIVTRQGHLVWANPKLNAYPREVVEAMRRHCTEMCAQLAEDRMTTDSVPARRRTVRVGSEYVFDVTVSPLLAADNRIEEVVGLVWDISASHRLQERINAIDAAGRELVRLDAGAAAHLEVSERLKLLEEKIIRFARELLEFDHFVIRLLDRKTNRLETIFASGLPEEAQRLEIYATTEGNGISGYVAATGRSYICPDTRKDPRYLPGIEHAGSSLTVPLWLHDQVIGVLNVESTEIAAFSEDDRQIAEIFGRYVAIALYTLKLLAEERYTTTGQITAELASELAGPLNDILTEVTQIMEDYSAQDELRRRLSAVISYVDRVKRSLRTVAKAPALSGLIGPTPPADPLLEGKRILVADDEDLIRETIADVLSKSGALTAMARDGQEAIAMIRTQHFDLVISDIKMPYKSGYEVFAAASQANVHCPVILITGFGYDPEHNIVRASREGLAGVLFKPFKVEQLLEQVRQALQKRP